MSRAAQGAAERDDRVVAVISATAASGDVVLLEGTAAVAGPHAAEHHVSSRGVNMFSRGMGMSSAR